MRIYARNEVLMHKKCNPSRLMQMPCRALSTGNRSIDPYSGWDLLFYALRLRSSAINKYRSAYAWHCPAVASLSAHRRNHLWHLYELALFPHRFHFQFNSALDGV
jgi:hypothetical protein